MSGVARRLDHRPLHAAHFIPVSQFKGLSHRQKKTWDFDKFTIEARAGPHRIQLINEIEKTLFEHGNDFSEASAQKTPDETWSLLMSILQPFFEKHFSRASSGNSRECFLKPFRKRRCELMQALLSCTNVSLPLISRRIAAYLGDPLTMTRIIATFTFYHCTRTISSCMASLATHAAERVIRCYRERVQNLRREELTQQMWEAWAQRDFALVWRLAHQLSGKPIGPKLRRLNHPPPLRANPRGVGHSLQCAWKGRGGRGPIL